MFSARTLRSRLLLFGGLYFAQGVPWGFFTVALQLRLTNLGLSPGTLAQVLALALLPWAWKPLLGPLVDRIRLGRLGGRRPFVLLSEAGMAATLLALASVDPAHSLGLYSALVLVHNVFAAAQDVGVDALALDILSADERGRVNGVMAAGKYAGMVVGGQGLTLVAEHAGWPAAFGVAIVLLLLPAALILGVEESARPREKVSVVLVFGRSFAFPVALLALLFAFLCDSSDYFTFPMMFPLMQRQLGYSNGAIITLSTVSGLVGATGSLVGGWLSDRIGRHWALALACFGVAATDVVFAAARPLWAHGAFFVSLSLAGALAAGMAFSAATALFMDLTNPRLAATQFQMFMSAWNLRSSGATWLGGRLADHASPAFMFGVAAVLELLPLLLLPMLDAQRAQAEYARREGNNPSRV